jgi:hypothetical protein
LWRYEVRRAGWATLLAPPLAALAVATFALVDGSAGAEEREASRNLFTALEMALPLCAGISAASLVGRDPVVELQLTLPTAYRATLLRRLAVAVAWTALVALLITGFLIATGWWARRPDTHGAFLGQLVWLAPTLWLAAAGLLAAALFRGPAAASGVVAVLWIVEQVFGDVVQEHRWSRLLYLFATTRGAVPGDWIANRLTLLASAVVLGFLAWLLLGRAERLVRGEVAE